MAWYVKGFEGATLLRQQLCQIESVEAGYELLDGAIALMDRSLPLTPCNQSTLV
jgi:hypothetical protein